MECFLFRSEYYYLLVFEYYYLVRSLLVVCLCLCGPMALVVDVRERNKMLAPLNRVPSGGGGGLQWQSSTGIRAFTTLVVTSLD
jgi:hypothetical protein